MSLISNQTNKQEIWFKDRVDGKSAELGAESRAETIFSAVKRKIEHCFDYVSFRVSVHHEIFCDFSVLVDHFARQLLAVSRSPVINIIFIIHILIEGLSAQIFLPHIFEIFQPVLPQNAAPMSLITAITALLDKREIDPALLISCQLDADGGGAGHCSTERVEFAVVVVHSLTVTIRFIPKFPDFTERSAGIAFDEFLLEPGGPDGRLLGFYESEESKEDDRDFDHGAMIYNRLIC